MSHNLWVSLERYGLVAGFKALGDNLFPFIEGSEEALTNAKAVIEGLGFRRTKDGGFVIAWAQLPTSEAWEAAFPAATFAPLGELANQAALNPGAREQMITRGLVDATAWPEQTEPEVEKVTSTTEVPESRQEPGETSSEGVSEEKPQKAPEWPWLNLSAYGLDVVVRKKEGESVIQVDGPQAAKHLIKDDLLAAGATVIEGDRLTITLPTARGAFDMELLQSRLELARIDRVSTSDISVKQADEPELERLDLSGRINREVFYNLAKQRVLDGIDRFTLDDIVSIAARSIGVAPLLMRSEFGINERSIQEQLESTLAGIFAERVHEFSEAESRIDFGHKLDALLPKEQSYTGSSKTLQQFSTPLSIAASLQTVLGIEEETQVWEPTAGNASLVSMASPENVHGMELDPERIKNLHSKGYTGVVQGDAIKGEIGETKFPRVIMNPPFGAFGDGAGPRIYESDVAPEGGGRTAFIRTGSQDQFIAMRHLEKLGPNGVGAIIVGADHPMRFKAGEYSDQTKHFLQFLGDTHNVIDVHYVDGKMYRSHGAGWPLLIVVTGDKREHLGDFALPDTLPVISNLDDLKQYTARVSELVQDYEKERGPGPENEREGGGLGIGGSGQGDTEIEPAEMGGDGALRQDEEEAEVEDSGGSARKKNEADNSFEDVDDDSTRQRHALDVEEKEVPYKPRSQMPSLDKRVPANLAAPIENALDRVESSAGDIDLYVAGAIGWTLEEMSKGLAAEQVDAIALALYQAQQGKGFILGDNTGIGKGRVIAALAVWGIRNGHKPVFCTSKAELFGDIMRDFQDIGEADLIKPFVLNDLQRDIVSADTGEVVVKRTPRTVVNKAIKDKVIPDEYNAVFMTYSQINREIHKCRKAQWLGQIADGNVLLFDEVHNASGPDSNTGYNVRDAVRAARFTMGASATYAKRPDNLGLYEFTSMFEGNDPESVIESVSVGGPEYQEVLSTMLAESGQLIVRAHEPPPPPSAVIVNPKYDEGFDSLEFSDRLARVLDAMTAVSEQSETIVNRENAAIKEAIRNLSTEGRKELSHWKSQTVNFGSQMHHIVRVANYAAKADAIIEEVVAAVEEGRRPLVAVEGTMESFLQVAYQNEIAKREELRLAEAERLGVELSEVAYDTSPFTTELTYRDTIKSYLDKMIVIKRTDRYGNETSEKIIDIEKYEDLYRLEQSGKAEGYGLRELIDKDLANETISDEQANTLRVYFSVLELIEMLPASLPASPIDYVRAKLEERGIKTGELTGRSLGLEYQTASGIPEFKIRSGDELNRRLQAHEFNNGSVQTLIFNSAAAEGVSLHAHKDFKNNEDRRTIFWQVPGDINVYTQMGGRTHRSGAREGASPDYRVICLDTPTEDRQMANLERKDGSLKANVKADRETGIAMRSEPMMNRVGDLVTWEVLNNHPLRASICKRLSIDLDAEREGFSLSGFRDKTGTETGLFSKVTGRLCRMVLADSKPLIEAFEEAYRDRIEHLDRHGINPLRTQIHDLRATLVAQKEIFPRFGPSAFESAVIAQQVTYTDYIEPISFSSIEDQLNKTRISLQAREFSDYPMKDLWSKIETELTHKLTLELEQGAQHLLESLPGNTFDKLEQARNIIRAQPHRLPQATSERLQNVVVQEDMMRKARDLLGVGVEFKNLPVGQILLDCDVDTADMVISRIIPPVGASNPALPGQWKIRFESPNPEVGRFDLSLNQLLHLMRQYPSMRGGLEPLEKSELKARFHEGRKPRTLQKERWIIMGNLPKGYSMTSNSVDVASGKPGVFTTESGRKLRGIIMPRDFDTSDLGRLMNSDFTIADFDTMGAYMDKKSSESHHPVFMSIAAHQMQQWANQERKEFHPGRGVVIAKDAQTSEWKIRISAMKKHNAHFLGDGRLQNLLDGDFATTSTLSKTMEAPVSRGMVRELVKHLMREHSQVFHAPGTDAEWYRNYMRERGDRLVQAEQTGIAGEHRGNSLESKVVSVQRQDGPDTDHLLSLG